MVEMRKNGRCGVLKGPKATPRNAEAVVVYKKVFVRRPLQRNAAQSDDINSG